MRSENLIILSLLLLAGCSSDQEAITTPPSNPYSGLTCDQLIAKVSAEVNTPENPGLIKLVSNNTVTCDSSMIPPLTQSLDKSSSVLVKSKRSFLATVQIRDYSGALVRRFVQEFGKNGELCNPNRLDSDGYVASYLVWDIKDESGNVVKDGVYQWEIKLMTSSQSLTQKIKVGVLFQEECGTNK